MMVLVVNGKDQMNHKIEAIWGVVRIMIPFWGSPKHEVPILIKTQIGIMILTTPHIPCRIISNANMVYGP